MGGSSLDGWLRRTELQQLGQ